MYAATGPPDAGEDQERVTLLDVTLLVMSGPTLPGGRTDELLPEDPPEIAANTMLPVEYVAPRIIAICPLGRIGLPVDVRIPDANVTGPLLTFRTSHANPDPILVKAGLRVTGIEQIISRPL